MFDFLPTVEPTELSGAPLTQVVAQVKMNAQTTLSTPAGVSLLHDALEDYPRLLTEQQAVFTASAAGMSTTQVPQWRMTDLEGTWAVVVGPEQLALETTSYTNWASFSERLSSALDALARCTEPRVQERVGLRYINQVPPDADGSYNDRVRPELIGLAGLQGWRSAMTASLSQTLVQDDGIQMAVRYGSGAQVVDADVFVLDIDCYDERPRAFDASIIMASFDTLNDVAYRCFSYCVPEAYRAALEGA